MDPLRNIEIIPAKTFARSDEMRTAPSDWEIPGREVAGVYMDFLDTLSPLERAVLAEDIAPTETGRIAEAVGITDVKAHPVGICGSPEPYKWKDSETVKRMLEDMDSRWESASAKAGVARPKSEQPRKYPWEQDRISLGFNRLVSEVIYGDYGDGWLTERPYPHIVELISDPERLRELANRWYDENYEARMAARATNLGNLATTTAGNA